MHLSPEIIDSSFRVSLCRDNTQTDMEDLLNGIQAVLDWKNR
jgi:cysteine sulfinate desulfinase/cysteine desulfurase-like protein